VSKRVKQYEGENEACKAREKTSCSGKERQEELWMRRKEGGVGNPGHAGTIE